MTHYENILDQLSSMQAALALEPALQINFSRVTLELLPVVLLALMFAGADTELQIYEKLYDRKFRYDSSVVRYVLDRFNGMTAGTHLWLRDPHGRYLPLFDDGLPEQIAA